MNKIKILLVDDMEQIRTLFRFMLASEADFEIVGEASSGKEAYIKAKELNPDIILMDIEMETETAGIDAVKLIKDELEDVKIIMLTIHVQEDLMFTAYINGAMDYVVKTSPAAEIAQAIRNVHDNKLFLRPEVSKRVMDELTRLHKNEYSLIYTLNIISKLTIAEFEVLKALYQGKTYKQISKERFVEETTLRVQANKILKKFNASKMSIVISQLKNLKIFDIYQ